MNTTNNPDWAWPALIQSLQRDISHLRNHVDEARREAAAAREAHRRELDVLIEQLREIRSHIAPILSEREAAKNARRTILWGWMGRAGWLLVFGIGLAVWHYIVNHLGIKHE